MAKEIVGVKGKWKGSCKDDVFLLSFTLISSQTASVPTDWILLKGSLAGIMALDQRNGGYAGIERRSNK